MSEDFNPHLDGADVPVEAGSDSLQDLLAITETDMPLDRRGLFVRCRQALRRICTSPKYEAL